MVSAEGLSYATLDTVSLLPAGLLPSQRMGPSLYKRRSGRCGDGAADSPGAWCRSTVHTFPPANKACNFMEHLPDLCASMKTPPEFGKPPSGNAGRFRGVNKSPLARLGGSWTWHMLYGLVSVVAGVIAVAWPGPTLIVLAVVLGAQLITTGLFRLVGASSLGEAGTARALTAILGVIGLLLRLRHRKVAARSVASGRSRGSKTRRQGASLRINALVRAMSLSCPIDRPNPRTLVHVFDLCLFVSKIVLGANPQVTGMVVKSLSDTNPLSTARCRQSCD